MSDAIVGKLVFQKTRSGPRRRVIFPTRKGESLPMPFASDQIDPSLLNSKDEVISVSLELEQGKPVRIRAAGEAWTEPVASASSPPSRPVQRRNAAAPQAGPAAIGSRFHNPYNSIPALPAAAGGLRQGPPVGHDRFHEDRWSGRIEISLEAVTPLLMLDTVNVEVDESSGHPTYNVRTGPDGKPEMAVTSLKGALCAAYEAITNSRLGVFKGHDDPLAYRMDARSELSGAAPARLLDDSLRPARSLAELSPADRVFGWVKQGGAGAYKGQLRIRKVSCETAKEKAIATFKEPLPLAILSTPKAQQARFYVGRSKECPIAQNAGVSKATAGYDKQKGLRGRKAYPHHAHTLGLDGYWDGDAARRGAGDAQRAPERLGPYFREYARRAGKEGARDDQNRSIKGWVAPGARFSACIDVVNLSDAELGALLWLLDLNRDRDVGPGRADRLRCLRVGGGKPLGFGSVKVAVTALCLETGGERKARYRELDPVPRASQRDPRSTVEAFRAAVEEGYGEMADKTDFLKAFLRAAEGFDDGHPIHYPRTAPADQGGPGPVPPAASGENFKWFQENERLSEGDRGLALEDLTSDSGLPYFREKG